jgi:teichuronic acid biosynthesis glycosyltransferase TuaC
MNHDVIIDRYARLYEQPKQLSLLGNEVLAICLSYRACEEIDHIDENSDRLRWVSFSPGSFYTAAILYPFRLYKMAKKFKPDLIVASSDCPHIALGYWLAKKLSINFAADLYDDYETFGLAKLPFLKFFYRNALRYATAISCVSISLANHIKNTFPDQRNIIALPSTIDKGVFYPRHKQSTRAALSLPLNAKIIGTAGGLTYEKGIKTVYDAFLHLAQENSSLQFVLAGPIDPKCPPPSHPQIHYLGVLPHDRIAELFCSLDVGIVYLRDTVYGKLSFPQKAFEMAACKIPMVVADIGDMSFLFSKEKNELYSADDTVNLEHCIEQQLRSPNVANLEINDWKEHARKLYDFYRTSLVIIHNDQ